MATRSYGTLALAGIVSIVLPGACLADGGIATAVGAMRGLLAMALIAAGVISIFVLAALVLAGSPKRIIFRIPLVLIFGVYVFFAVGFFYLWETSELLLTLFFEAWVVSGLLILLLFRTRSLRIALLAGLVLATLSINVPYPRLVDFYARTHVDNRGDFTHVDFTREAYWRILSAADGRQFLITAYPPGDPDADTPVERLGRYQLQRMLSPMVLAPKSTATTPPGWDILELRRTPDSYLADRPVYFSLPILGERVTPKYDALTIGEAVLLTEGIAGMDLYFAEVLNRPSRDKSSARLDFWAQKLLELGADPNYADQRYGYSPLMIAIRNNRYEATKLLIGKGADVNQTDNQGKTPLHVAAMVHSDYVALLLQNGASPVSKDARGNTPLDAVRRGPLGGKRRNSEGKFVADVDSPRYRDGLKSLELLESSIRDTRAGDAG